MLRFPRHLPLLIAASAALVTLAAAAPASAGTQLTARTASTLTAGPAATFTALAFPAPASGWVLGQASSGGPARIWHTATGGASWQVQWTGAGNPLAISAPDPAHAWALIACARSCGRELLATTDAGGHWRVAATVPRAVNQIEFVTGQLGVATSDQCLADLSLSHCPGQLLLSRDGGAHWAPVLSSPVPVFATMSATGQLWAAAVGTTTVTISSSIDGGHRWSRLGRLASSFPLSPETRVSLAATTAGGLTWASVFDQLSCAMHGCAVAALQGSSDGGRHWSPVSLASPSPDDCGSDSMVLSVAPDDSAWAATGRNGAACAPPLGLLYQQAGTAWAPRPAWELSQVSALAAVSGQVAWAVSDGDAISRTTDGGAHWNQLLPAPAPAGLLDVLTPVTALAAQDASDAGAILASADGGRSWDQIAQLPGIVTQLDFWSAQDGLAATYQPGAASPWQLWTSSDGGEDWLLTGPLPAGALPPGDGSIAGPWMSASGYGLLLTVTGSTPWEGGSGGTPPARIWTTADGGLTWDRGALLALGGDILAGSPSFASYPGPVPGAAARWSGWLVIDTAGGDQRVAATSDGPLSLLPASVPAGAVQLISPRVGVTWSLNYPGGSPQAVLSLARTTDGGQRWLHSSVRLLIPSGPAAGPLLGFGDASHGWLVVGNRTWHTADGGQTWTRA